MTGRWQVFSCRAYESTHSCCEFTGTPATSVQKSASHSPEDCLPPCWPSVIAEPLEDGDVDTVFVTEVTSYEPTAEGNFSDHS